MIFSEKIRKQKRKTELSQEDVANSKGQVRTKQISERQYWTIYIFLAHYAQA